MTSISRFTERDRRCLEVMGALDRCSLDIVLGVARRCSFGAPQVLLCAPEKRARPFPTSYWLVCAHLVRVAGRLESLNAVDAMRDVLRGRGDEWRRYNLFHARLRLSLMSRARKNFLLRRERRMFDAIRLGGVGGIARYARGAVKCVHLQMASYLGAGSHPSGDWLDGHAGSWECAGGYCSSA